MSSNGAPDWASHPDLLEYYASHRHRPEDLYSSERRFLPWLARQCASVMDAGCAAGGFKAIWRHFNPRIRYVGADVSPSLIDIAKKLNPDTEFMVGNVTEGLPLPDRCAGVVQALGWLHWEPQYPAAIEELWRLTERFLFFDVRLVPENKPSLTARQKLTLSAEWDGRSTVPYVTVNWGDFAKWLLVLEPRNILAYGYWGDPAETVVGFHDQVCFAAFVLEKPTAGTSRAKSTLCIDLPLPWPTHMCDRVRLLPASDLESLVPWD